MNRWIPVTVSALLFAGACVTQDDFCQRRSERCEVKYDRVYGYYRECSYVAGWCMMGLDVPGNAGGEGAQTSAGAGGGASTSEATAAVEDHAQQGGQDDSSSSQQDDSSDAPAGAAQPPGTERYSAFEFDCSRDSQCGPGRCLEGDCYYGCNSDAECGSGDRCSVESGTRICLPDPNPPVECTRSAQCENGHVCLNGACRQQCTQTEQCANLLDRCLGGVCGPDRRPLGECVLDVECAEGLACLDGECVEACSREADDARACGAEPTAPDPVEPDPAQSGDPTAEEDQGDVGAGAADAGAPPPIE